MTVLLYSHPMTSPSILPFSLQLDESVPLHGIDKAIGHFEVHYLSITNTVNSSVYEHSRVLMDTIATACAAYKPTYWDNVAITSLSFHTIKGRSQWQLDHGLGHVLTHALSYNVDTCTCMY